MGMRPNGTCNPGMGYRYYGGDLVNFAFGYGLSYTQFECSGFTKNDNVFGVTVTNSGEYNGGGAVMLYFFPANAGVKGTPQKRLVGFERINMLEMGQSGTVNLELYAEFVNSVEYRNNLGSYKFGGICDVNV